jgi:hypothetical protein
VRQGQRGEREDMSATAKGERRGLATDLKRPEIERGESGCFPDGVEEGERLVE